MSAMGLLHIKPEEISMLEVAMSSQKQNAGAGAEAYQAQGDITINRGMTSAQVSQVIGEIVSHLAVLSADAERRAEERRGEFREEILNRIAGTEERVREAFRDPDFQYTVKSGFDGYTRKGTLDLKMELAELLVSRAKVSSDSRVSSVLNHAIEITPKLTKQDKDVLVCLFVGKVMKMVEPTVERVWLRYEAALGGHTDDLPTSNGPFEFLNALGCIELNRVADHYPLSERLYAEYNDLIPKTVASGPKMPDGQTGPTVLSPSMSQSQFFDGLCRSAPSFAKLQAVWETGFYKNSYLSSTGKAIAHCILTTEARLSGPLEVFLQY